eukprot:COSAG02_NODE_358_length_23882_cov_25.508683_18_plen_83_part_00
MGDGSSGAGWISVQPGGTGRRSDGKRTERIVCFCFVRAVAGWHLAAAAVLAPPLFRSVATASPLLAVDVYATCPAARAVSAR